MEGIPLPRLELSRLHEQLGDLFSGAAQDEQTLQSFLRFTLSLVNGSAAAIHTAGDNGQDEAALLLSRQAQSWSDDLRGEMAANAEQAGKENKALIVPLRRAPAATLFSVPFDGGEVTRRGCLSVVLLPGSQAPEIFVAILQLLAINLGMMLRHDPAAAETFAAGPSSQLCRLLAEVIEEADPKRAASLLVNRLRDILQADAVIFAANPAEGKPQVLAISSLADFNRQSPAARTIQQVLDECRLHGQPLAWPAAGLPGEIASPILRALAADYSAEHAVCLPVMDSKGACSGQLLVLRQGLAPERRREMHAVLAASSPILGSLGRWLNPSRRSATSKFAGLPVRKKLILVSLLLLACIGLCCLPVRHRISADCVLMPLTTRAVVAQFDGILQSVAREAGEKVHQGEKIAQLDGQAIELEIGSLAAEIAKSRKLQDVSMVAGQTASAQIARLEGERLSEKLRLLQLHSTMLTVRSPIDGVIIRGTVDKAEGGPVSKGQTLFEIAPLAEMIVELHIRQEDFQHVAKDSLVQVGLDSYPGRVWASAIRTIHPKTEPRQGRYVFIARCQLDNPKGELQPGMNGTATVAAGYRPLAWVALNRPWTALRKIFR